MTFNGKVYADWREARASIVAEPAPVAVLDETPTIAQDGRGDGPSPTESPEAVESCGIGQAASPEPARRVSLTEKHRPRRLAEIVGQPEAVAALRAFVADPYPAAFILAGATGTGKSSAAYALAGELGCDLDGWSGGVQTIASGDHTADTLREVWRGLSLMPMTGSGWNVLIVNETENINPAVEKLWMDKLENMPDKLAVVFTTNAVDTLPARFVDRCIGGVLTFDSSFDRLETDARQLAARIWRAETGQEIPGDVLDRVTGRATQAGHISFRRVIQALVPLLAAKGRGA